MTIDEFVSAVRALAAADGTITDERFWVASRWRDMFANGLTPADAWDAVLNPALGAL